MLGSRPQTILLIDSEPQRDARTERQIGTILLHVVALVNPAALCEIIEKIKPGVVLIDIDAPNGSAFDAADHIRRDHPDQPLALIARWFSNTQLKHAMKLDAIGCITKGEPLAVMTSALNALANGERYYSPSVRRRLTVDERGVRFNDEDARSLDLLTQREFEVLKQIAEGLTKKQIAEQMHISPKTVSTHTERLMDKLDLHDRVALTRFAIREGIAAL